MVEYSMHANDKFISCILRNVSGVSILCTTIYASNDELKYAEIWNYIEKKSNYFNLSWIVAGDFNSILSSKHRLNNGKNNSIGDKGFIDCSTASKLAEPNFTANFSHGEVVKKFQYIVKLIMCLSNVYGWTLSRSLV